ncbi:MAG: ATP-dependent zinc metalloprotease FtsH [Candidatus Berkelbacteria bacterium]|nr:ATP-dependent zinc metalloprotease FtsH [Candidatus Berkelbacteria bacterium]
MNNKPSIWSRVALYAIILIIIGVVVSGYYSQKNAKTKNVGISNIVSDVTGGNVSSVDVKDNQVTANLKDGSKEIATIETGATLKDYGITPDKITINVTNTTNSIAWATILSTIIPILLIGGFIWFMFRSAQGNNAKAMSFGKSRAKLVGDTKTSFDDVAGLVEPKQELYEVVDFLRSPAKFKKLGAEIPHGVLLVGPPGTGKTLLAKAVAGEASVPFFSISASEFVEMFVGVGASRVRDLFVKAKRNAPSIIFIDELDAIGRQRGAGMGGGHDEREQTLNQILVEMDGFDTDANVIVMAATNRPDILDAALLRPGRFDRQIAIDLPDKNERAEILKVHVKNKPLAEGVDLEKIAVSTAGFSGADLRNLMNEAAILAARGNSKTVSQLNLDNAIEKVMMGPERKSRLLSAEEKKITSVHESGHAIVSHILPNSDPIHKISVISRGSALGYTWSLPQEDRRLMSKSKFLDDLAAMLAGRAAEEIVFGEITTGASNDMQRATKLARKMVTEFGMSDVLGPQTYGEKEELIFLGREISESKNYSDEVAAKIDKEVASIIDNAYQLAKKTINSNRKILDKISTDLLKKEVIVEDEFLTYFPKEVQRKIKAEEKAL